MRAWLPLFGLSVLLIGCSQSVLRPYQVQKPGVTRTDTSAEAPSSVPADASSEVLDNGAKADDAASSDNSTPAAPGANTPPANAVPATGSVAVNVNIIPPTPAGPYRNRGHIRSLWITDANNKYLKTIHALAGQRSVHLKRWQVFTNRTLDATTGATQVTPAAGIPVTATWDLKDKAGATMLTGNYKLWLEFTEANTPTLDAGKTPGDPAQAIDATNGYEYLVVPFSVSPAGTTKTDSSNAVFKDVAVKHVP
ncbi:MAG TPA: hypothetical protein VE954_25340 [Oligoflexus sp.]|uniref:hypothetical protein n=1 Tax=Oligoflexus sp. TaxID=1971216 RepID=UPI002D3DFF4B|nr:hypothetical protein [Oligoflexus sp.]HYX36445.1 hypothetical protein [Oligoflexus sp.]